MLSAVITTCPTFSCFIFSYHTLPTENTPSAHFSPAATLEYAGQLFNTSLQCTEGCLAVTRGSTNE